MDRPIQTFIFFLSVVCCLSSINVAQGKDPRFYVEGEVYCDTCRAQFVTRLSELMSGAKVRLECRDREGGNVSYTVEGETDESGHYRLPVDGDHEAQICEVVPVNSSNPDCAETGKEGWAKPAGRISLASHNGMIDSIRRANPLGFMKKEALPQCLQAYKEMDMLPPDM